MDEDEPKGAGEMPIGSGRRPKSQKQKHAAAGHSKKHREAQRAAGVPAGRQIDTEIASFLLRGIVRSGGAKATDHLPVLREQVMRAAGWNCESEDVRKAVDARIMRLLAGAQKDVVG